MIEPKLFGKFLDVIEDLQDIAGEIDLGELTPNGVTAVLEKHGVKLSWIEKSK